MAGKAPEHNEGIEYILSCRDIPQSRTKWFNDDTREYRFYYREGQNLTGLNPDELLGQLQGHEHVLVIAHGWKEHFSDILENYDTLVGEIRKAEERRGKCFDIIIGLLWPSGTEWSFRGGIKRAARAGPSTNEVLQMICKKVKNGHVHLVAHSLGNWLLWSALLHDTSNTADKYGLFHMLAPAVDRKVFDTTTSDARFAGALGLVKLVRVQYSPEDSVLANAYSWFHILGKAGLEWPLRVLSFGLVKKFWPVRGKALGLVGPTSNRDKSKVRKKRSEINHNEYWGDSEVADKIVSDFHKYVKS